MQLLSRPPSALRTTADRHYPQPAPSLQCRRTPVTCSSTSNSGSKSSIHRRDALAAATLTLLSPLLLPAPSPAAAPAATTTTTTTTSPAAASPPATTQFEKDLEDFVAQTSRAEAMDPKQLQALRVRFGFRRSPTGKVQVRGQSGDWYDIRLDMQLPGVCIVRNPRGDIFMLELGQVQQIDLSNDLILVSLFGDGTWEDALQKLELGDGEQQLNMGSKEFRESLGILSDVLEVAAVEQQQQQQQQQQRGR